MHMEGSTQCMYGETIKETDFASYTIDVYTIAIICRCILLAQCRIDKGQIIILNDRLIPPSVPRMVQNTYK